MSESVNRPIVITVTNRKGGVGKTATVVNTGAGLAVNGHRVLLVDLDPSQASLTLSLIGHMPPEHKGIISGFLEEGTLLEDIVYETPTPNLSILPSEKDYGGKEAFLDMALSGEIGRESFLKNLLDSDFARDHFDFVLIDTGPELSLLTINALNASDFFVVPTNTDILSLVGLADTFKIADKVKKINPKLKSLGSLITKLDRRFKDTAQVSQYLKEQFGQEIFDTTISVNSKFRALPKIQKTIFEMERKSEKGHRDYNNFAQELVRRVDEIGVTP
ncbi:MAG: ParA family protein [Bdellovibrionales bacterium]|nr:ParA family protein [Bdellovibrionales bacterium]MBT3525097.1 ParA family protein [Bdellovibrionales bacterium]MBT7670226.1 ParA family protein [Bdellovibrionales bacterium]